MKHITHSLEEGVSRVILNRPDVKNAFNDEVISEFNETWNTLSADPSVRVLILSSAGDLFSAGADLNWMKAMAGYGREKNITDADLLFDCMEGLALLPFPTICRVQGSAFGGALGLMAACDIVIASESASFAFTEVRLGLAPAVISPFVAGKLSPGLLRELFLTGRRFTAEEAASGGLINRVVGPTELDDAVETTAKQILKGSPAAQREIKTLLEQLPFPGLKEARVKTAALIADLRASKEGGEGMDAFFERRLPEWVK